MSMRGALPASVSLQEPRALLRAIASLQTGDGRGGPNGSTAALSSARR
jgi:hypothetical protein